MDARGGTNPSPVRSFKTTEKTVKPLMYGYMRVIPEAEDEELDGVVQQMKTFAELEGFCYTTTFFEYTSGSHAAFEELTEELKRAEARHVVVPSFAHLSAHPLICNHMAERLERDANPQVLPLDNL